MILFTECWEADRKNRPSFEELHSMLKVCAKEASVPATKVDYQTSMMIYSHTPTYASVK
jgi:hypothetical protein